MVRVEPVIYQLLGLGVLRMSQRCTTGVTDRGDAITSTEVRPARLASVIVALALVLLARRVRQKRCCDACKPGASSSRLTTTAGHRAVRRHPMVEPLIEPLSSRNMRGARFAARASRQCAMSPMQHAVTSIELLASATLGRSSG